MRTHAIVIGIDEYANPQWRLRGAVRDAIAFARWADGNADLDPSGKLLLVSPQPPGSPAGWRVDAPTTDKVLDALAELRGGPASKPDRLLFFFAGHACTPPTRTPEDGPVLVPVNCRSLGDVGQRGVDLSVELQMLRADGPATQLLFIDGCRDVLAADGAVMVVQQAVWNLSNVHDALATQAVLYATRSGRWANELGGGGVFTRALLDGLTGKGPHLPVDELQGTEMLTFSALGDFVKERVQAFLAGHGLDRRKVKTQAPTWDVTPRDADVVIRSYAIGQGPRVRVRVRVEPAGARRASHLEILERNTVTRQLQAAQTVPCAPAVTDLDLPAGTRMLRVQAPGYEPTTAALVLRADDSLFLELEPSRTALLRAGGAEEALESVIAPVHGTLHVRSRDAQVRITVRDATGAILAAGIGRVEKELDVGPYVVDAVLPGLPAQRETVVVGGGVQSVDVGPRPTSPGPAMALAKYAGTETVDSDGYAWPSEHLGPVGDLRLASLLAYAAWAALWRNVTGDACGFYKLSAWQVAAPVVDPCALLVLVGDSKSSTPLSESARFTIVRAGEPDRALPSLEPILGAPIGAQTYVALPPGAFRIRMEADGLAATSFAAVTLPGFVTVLVITREEWGDIEVGVFLLPHDPRTGPAPGLPAPGVADIRALDLAPRALVDGVKIVEGEYGGALATGEWSNPLAAVIAGYRLWREGRIEDFAPTLTKLLPDFAAIPDLRVLEALCLIAAGGEDGEIWKALHAAAEAAPLVAMGLRELLARLDEKETPIPEGLGLVPGTLWTTLAALPPRGSGSSR